MFNNTAAWWIMLSYALSLYYNSLKNFAHQCLINRSPLQLHVKSCAKWLKLEQKGSSYDDDECLKLDTTNSTQLFVQQWSIVFNPSQELTTYCNIFVENLPKAWTCTVPTQRLGLPGLGTIAMEIFIIVIETSMSVSGIQTPSDACAYLC